MSWVFFFSEKQSRCFSYKKYQILSYCQYLNHNLRDLNFRDLSMSQLKDAPWFLVQILSQKRNLTFYYLKNTETFLYIFIINIWPKPKWPWEKLVKSAESNFILQKRIVKHYFFFLQNETYKNFSLQQCHKSNIT